MEIKEAVKLWKELLIESATMEFSCGGDSMNDYSFTFYGGGKEIESTELKDYFEDAVFNHVEFYVNSDGHYQGEAGTVEISIDEEDENEFSYSKTAESEYEEQHEEEAFIPISAPMIKFIKENVSNINGSSDEDAAINFKKDLILSDKNEKLLSDIQSLLKENVSEFEPKGISDELNDYRTFTTGEEGEPIIKGNSLRLNITVSYTEYVDSE